jgi:hypothetical protein
MHRWEDNRPINKVVLKETECEGVDWIYLAQGRDPWRALVNTVVNVRIYGVLL